MGVPDRRVAAVRLAAPRPELVRRGAVLLEDALRTAAGVGEGARQLLVRRVDVGAIRAGRASAAVAVVLERRFRWAASVAVHGTDAAAVHAHAVWFRDAVEAHAALALRLAGGSSPAGWFWRLAVPRWRPGMGRHEALRAVLGSAAEAAPGPFAAVAVLAELVEAGAAGPLLGALRWQDGPALLRACGWQAPSAPVRLLRAGVFVVGDDGDPGDAERRALLAGVPRAWTDALAGRAHAWGEDDARTLWLAAAALVTASPSRALDPHLPGRAACLVAAVLDARQPLIAARSGGRVPVPDATSGPSEALPGLPREEDLIPMPATPEPRPPHAPPAAASHAWGEDDARQPVIAARSGRRVPAPDATSGPSEALPRLLREEDLIPMPATPEPRPPHAPQAAASIAAAARQPSLRAGTIASPAARVPEPRGHEHPPATHPRTRGEPPVAPRDASSVALHLASEQAAEAAATREMEPHRPSISINPAVDWEDARAAESAELARAESPVAESPASPSPARARFPETPLRTAGGGLAFVVPVLERLGIAGMLRDAPWAADAAFPARLLRHLALRVGIPADDPVLAAFGAGELAPVAGPAGWCAPAVWARGIAAPGPRMVRTAADGGRAVFDASGRLALAAWRGKTPAGAEAWLADAIESPLSHARTCAPSHPSPLAAWTTAARRWCRRGARVGIATLLHRPARVLFTRTHVDVVFDHHDADLRVRRAGLDVDPGWVPWLGRVVQFHYLYGERPGAS